MSGFPDLSDLRVAEGLRCRLHSHWPDPAQRRAVLASLLGMELAELPFGARDAALGGVLVAVADAADLAGSAAA